MRDSASSTNRQEELTDSARHLLKWSGACGIKRRFPVPATLKEYETTLSQGGQRDI